jgi:GNAT superfamily N-acetyltransferase
VTQKRESVIITPAQPDDLPRLLAFREEAAAWLAALGTDQWRRPYPADRLLAAVRRRTVFMVRDGDVSAATITVAPDPGEGLWTAAEASEPAMYVSKLTVARSHTGQGLGGRLLDWAGDRAYRASAKWLRLDAWTTNHRLQDYYLGQGFRHVRTVLEGEALYGGPRVSGWLAQREARPGDVRPSAGGGSEQ